MAFIDLTDASTRQTPTKLSQPADDISSSNSSLQASRSHHTLLFQQSQRNLIDDDEGVGLRIEANGRVHLFPTLSAATGTRRSFIEQSPPRRKLSQFTDAHIMDEVEILSSKPTSNRRQGSFQAAALSRSLEVPLGRLAIGATSPPTKRRRIGLCRPTNIGRNVNRTSSLNPEMKLRDGAREENIIDLTISDNFPTWKYSRASPKRGSHGLSVEPDSSREKGDAAKRTLCALTPTDPAANAREVAVSKKLAAPGIRRRLAALGLVANIDPKHIVDLSADSESDAEDEPKPDLTQEPFCQRSVIGPEDYLDDDEISKLLAKLEIGPVRGGAATPKTTTTRIRIEEHSQGNSRYKAGKSAELKDGNFLRIVSVLRSENGDVFLSGHLLSRQSSWGRAMPKRKNELVWVMEISIADFEAGYYPNPTEVPLVEAVGIRSITFTNQQYPEMSLKTYKDGGFRNTRDELSTGPLFCRWKSTKVIGERNQKYEENLVHLSYAEADPKPKARIRPCIVRDMWRGSKTVLGGSHIATRQSSINLVSSHPESASEHIQQYTFGDAFCGAGGCSSGAAQAGLRVNWGFDKDRDTIRVYAANIGQREGARSLNEAVDEFCNRPEIGRFTVDILHLSPPCQPFSAAHTVPSEVQDEINQAALLSVGHVLEKIKPRVATLEETEGLVNRHFEWFSALINIFVTLGYSVRWKVVRCQDYGVPQQRKRLFIIAAGPAEILPPFAKPTHGEPGSGLQAFKKIRHYVRDIPRSATQHETSDRFKNGPRLPFSDDQFAKTLTCSGGMGNYHPSGLRLYTIREAASLQTFPISHTFTPESKTKARRQIGNAVPPLLARSMYREIIKSLKESDRLEGLSEAGQV